MEPANSSRNPLNILMASGVLKRREGGVAGVIYNLGRELQHLGHHVTYIFQEDLIEPGSLSSRFKELVFSLRLCQYIAKSAHKFSIVNLHAPTGFPYGARRRWRRSAEYPPYVMTLHGLEQRRVHPMSREAKKGRPSNYSPQNLPLHPLYPPPQFPSPISQAPS